MYTPQSFNKGAGAYARVGLEIGAMSASPHQLITMLFDGARTAMGMARHHMASGDIAAKGEAISKAINIIDNGLKASLDASGGGKAAEELVTHLSALYDYVKQRLMYANLRNDPRMLDQAERLLDSVSSAWREIGPSRAVDAADAAAPGVSGSFSVRQ
jgi:flagellar protein FliS